jgi:hypothetical protein
MDYAYVSKENLYLIFNLIVKYKVKESFDLWKCLTLYHRSDTHLVAAASYPQYICTRHPEIPTHDYIITRNAWRSAGARRLGIVLWSLQHRLLQRHFHRWRGIIASCRCVLYAYFMDWNLKLHRTKLLRLHAHRLAFILRPIARKWRARNINVAFLKWRSYLDWYRTTIRGRLFFRIWKSFTHHSKHERSLMQSCLATWHGEALASYRRLASLSDILSMSQHERLVRRCFRTWLMMRKRADVLGRCAERMLLRCAINTWLENIALDNFPTNISAPTSPNTHIAASPQSDPQPLPEVVGTPPRVSIATAKKNVSRKSENYDQNRKPPLPSYLKKKPTSGPSLKSAFMSSKNPPPKIPRHHRDCKCMTCRNRVIS